MSDIQNKDSKNGMKSLTVKQRIEFIDLAKGVCILLVIMTHTDMIFQAFRLCVCPFILSCQVCFSKTMEAYAI